MFVISVIIPAKYILMSACNESLRC